MIEPASRPRLRRGVRLSFDRVRDVPVLLYPEGVLFPNPAAHAVLRRCDGSTTVAGIVAELDREFRGVDAADVAEILHRFAATWVVTLG